MTCVSCSVPERFVNPLFEVFDGGDFVLSSYRDIEEPAAHMRIFFEDAAETSAAEKALSEALAIVGLDAKLEVSDVPEEDWKFAYRRHFKTEQVSPRIFTVPEWEADGFFKSGRLSEGQVAIVSDPGMAFGTGKHETTRACLQYIDEILGEGGSDLPAFLDMGTGSGILSIAAAKLGCAEVVGFDVDPEAVEAAKENAAKNGVNVRFEHFALGRAAAGKPPLRFSPADLVVANILGPLLIRFADEIVRYAKDKLIVSGILDSLYTEVAAAYAERGFAEVSHRTLGEWTTGLLTRERRF